VDFAGLKHLAKFEESGVCLRYCCWQPLGDLAPAILSPSVFAVPLHSAEY